MSIRQELTFAGCAPVTIEPRELSLQIATVAFRAFALPPASPLPEPHEFSLALFPLTSGKFNAHVGHQHLRFTHDIPCRLSRADRALRREKSRRAFHLE